MSHTLCEGWFNASADFVNPNQPAQSTQADIIQNTLSDQLMKSRDSYHLSWYKTTPCISSSEIHRFIVPKIVAPHGWLSDERVGLIT